MADRKLTELPTGSAPSNSDYIYSVQDGVSVKQTIGAIRPREKLTSNRTYYVRANGADSTSRTGLTNADGDAFASFWFAYETAIQPKLDLNGFNVTLQGDGSTLEGLMIGDNTVNPWVGGGQIIVDNAGGIITGSRLADGYGFGCIGTWVQLFGQLSIQNAILSNPANAGGFALGIIAASQCNIHIGDNVAFHEVEYYHIWAINGGVVGQKSQNTITVTGNALAFIQCQQNGTVSISSSTIDFASPVTFAWGVIIVDPGPSYVEMYSTVFVNGGNVTGQRFFVAEPSNLSTNTSLQFIPGTIEGVAVTGSRYGDWPDYLLAIYTAAGDITALPAETKILVNKTVGAATHITMYDDTLHTYGNYGGIVYTIKDAKGDATSNNITIVPASGGTIDGAANKVISTNYGVVRMLHGNGSNVWYTV